MTNHEQPKSHCVLPQKDIIFCQTRTKKSVGCIILDCLISEGEP